MFLFTYFVPSTVEQEPAAVAVPAESPVVGQNSTRIKKIATPSPIAPNPWPAYSRHFVVTN
jgi:hypothetical protein